MKQKMPNILWLCTDQQRKDTLGCYGNQFVHTPNLDRLAKMGVRFERAYAQNPVCAPSRASFLTGRYPRTCSVRQNGQDIREDERLVPKILSEQGYTCGLSGKLHLSACGPEVCRVRERRIDDGYDYFKWSHHPSEINPAGNWPMNEYTMWLTAKGKTYQTPPRSDCKYVNEGMPPEDSQTKWCVDMAMDYIESARQYDLPWLFSVNFYDPHHAFDPPKEYLDPYLKKLEEIPLPNYREGELDEKPAFQALDHQGAYGIVKNFPYTEMDDHDHRMIRAAYWAMCDQIDAQVGRILDYLEESGQLSNTLIIYMSDHGENLGDHGMYLKGPYFYENNVNVPLIISWPGVIEGGRVSDALVELVDLAPTICEAAGIQPEEGMQGKSLWPMLMGNAPLSHHRDTVYSEYYNSNINHRDPMAFCTMVRDERYKLVKVHPRNGNQTILGELYDLEIDPEESHNLFYDPSYSEVKMRMLELLCDRMAQTIDPLPRRRSFW